MAFFLNLMVFLFPSFAGISLFAFFYPCPWIYLPAPPHPYGGFSFHLSNYLFSYNIVPNQLTEVKFDKA